MPVGAGVPQQVQLPKLQVLLQVPQACNPAHINEIHRQVQLPQELAAGKALDRCEVVQRHVEVLQVLHVDAINSSAVLYAPLPGRACNVSRRERRDAARGQRMIHLESLQALETLDEIILQVKNLEVGTSTAQQLDLLDTLLLQSDLLKV